MAGKRSGRRRHRQQQQGNQQVSVYEEQQVVVWGPLPAPEDLAAYEAAQPGAGERIMASADKEAWHRRLRQFLLVIAILLGVSGGVTISALLLWRGEPLGAGIALASGTMVAYALRKQVV